MHAIILFYLITLFVMRLAISEVNLSAVKLTLFRIVMRMFVHAFKCAWMMLTGVGQNSQISEILLSIMCFVW